MATHQERRQLAAVRLIVAIRTEEDRGEEEEEDEAEGAGAKEEGALLRQVKQAMAATAG